MKKVMDEMKIQKICSSILRHSVPVVLVLSFVFFTLISSGEAEVQADRILVEKSKRKMTLYQGDKTLKTYRIALGKNPAGHKVRKGDEKTPVGKYYIDYRNPDSRFHLSLHISYPNDRDIMRSMKRDVTPGGDIMIHGLNKETEWLEEYHRFIDWTDGCIAVTNREIEEIWDLVPDGTPVIIRP